MLSWHDLSNASLHLHLASGNWICLLLHWENKGHEVCPSDAIPHLQTPRANAPVDFCSFLIQSLCLLTEWLGYTYTPPQLALCFVLNSWVVSLSKEWQHSPHVGTRNDLPCSSSAPFTTGMCNNGARLTTEELPSLDAESAATLNLNFTHPRIVQNKFLSFISVLVMDVLL